VYRLLSFIVIVYVHMHVLTNAEKYLYVNLNNFSSFFQGSNDDLYK
jgi:hypothetical protein